MKRCISALAASITLALGAGVSVASADGGFVPSPTGSLSQSNESDQGQIQVVPIAPQVNVQNVNVATHGDVEQGDANNANTGQANQQENTAATANAGSGQSNDSDQKQIQFVPIAPQVNVQNVNVATHGDVEQGDANNANTGQANQQENTSKGGHSSPAPSTTCGSCSKPNSGGGQSNDSDQSQIQIVPMAPQVNVQNVNVATHGDVEQGDANNANTGQASQQENTSKAGHGSPAPSSKCGSCSKPNSGGGQSNDSDQSQIQIVPVAPQKNVQNVNLFTFDDVKQGDANNANTGQANQQHNSQASSRPSYAKPAPNGYGKSSSQCDRCDSTRSGYQSNRSEQKQIQFIPIAPQHNFQNVNVFTGGDVRQGDVNNANTGQANQQENSQASSRPTYSKPAPRGYGKSTPSCGCGSTRSGYQSNRSEQKQIQFIPIAPQLNVQNFNLFTFGKVRQGDANNANTGQANQQKNWSSGGKSYTPPCHSSCGPPKPCGCQPPPKHEPKPCGCQPPPKHEPKPCGCQPPPKQCGCQPAPKECGCHAKKSSGQSNKSSQKQIQIVPIAPQLNVQNANVLTFGDVKQGDANNANTGQASQQHNTLGAAPKKLEGTPNGLPV
jgi:hypothetical protein